MKETFELYQEPGVGRRYVLITQQDENGWEYRQYVTDELGYWFPDGALISSIKFTNERLAKMLKRPIYIAGEMLFGCDDPAPPQERALRPDDHNLLERARGYITERNIFNEISRGPFLAKMQSVRLNRFRPGLRRELLQETIRCQLAVERDRDNRLSP